MSYCSLEEAYGKDFCNQVNNDNMLGYSTSSSVSKMNPNRNTFLPGVRHDLKTNSQSVMKQATQDIREHRKSFDSIKTIMPWGEEEDELSPREYLKQSLLKDRVIKSSGETNEPSGFSNSSNYKALENSKCQDFFFHLDTCKKCQHKMKRRVVRYLKALQKYKSSDYSLPGLSNVNSEELLDKELFSDGTDTYYEKDVVENFSNPTFNINNILLLGCLFIIYMMTRK